MITSKERYQYNTNAISMGLWHISLTISGSKPFYQAYKIMSLLISFNGQKGFWKQIKHWLWYYLKKQIELLWKYIFFLYLLKKNPVPKHKMWVCSIYFFVTLKFLKIRKSLNITLIYLKSNRSDTVLQLLPHSGKVFSISKTKLK